MEKALFLQVLKSNFILPNDAEGPKFVDEPLVCGCGCAASAPLEAMPASLMAVYVLLPKSLTLGWLTQPLSSLQSSEAKSVGRLPS
jgi:hypothetical protein